MTTTQQVLSYIASAAGLIAIGAGLASMARSRSWRTGWIMLLGLGIALFGFGARTVGAVVMALAAVAVLAQSVRKAIRT